MPAGATATKNRRPLRFMRLGGLPQNEIKWVAFVFIDRDAFTRLQIIQIFL